MLKTLRVILGGFFSLTLLLLLIGYFLSNEYDFSRPAVLDTGCEQVFNYVNDLQNLGEFIPWLKKDATIRFDHTSPSEGIGARVRWTSQESANGSFTITESESPSKIAGELDFFDLGKSEGYLSLESQGEACAVRFGFRGKVSAPRPLASWFSTLLPFFVAPELERALNGLEAILKERES